MVVSPPAQEIDDPPLGLVHVTLQYADVCRLYSSRWRDWVPGSNPTRVELPLIISDHADWNELTMTIREIEPAEVWITHGREGRAS